MPRGAPSRYLRVPTQCGRLLAGVPRGMTPLRGGAGPHAPPPAPRCSAPSPRGGMEGKRGQGWGGRECAVSSRRLSPDGQRKPLAELAASPSQCAHLAERGEGEGRELLHFWGRYQPPRPSPAPHSPPPPPTPASHPPPPRLPGPASSSAAQTPPHPSPGSAASVLPVQPHILPHTGGPISRRQPFPQGKKNKPRRRGGQMAFDRFLTEFSSSHHLLFLFAPPSKSAALSEAGDSNRVRGSRRGCGA